LQGLALGGEYGGAATYVAEHAPNNKRGLFTSYIQTTATLGLFLSLLVILACRVVTGKDFEVWGWRIPFLISLLLLAVSVYIRSQLNESPAFKHMKAEGKQSKAPLTEAFGKWSSMKVVLTALFGAVVGQAVVWYTGQFYALFFLTKVLKIDDQTANLLTAGGLLIGTPFFVVFGALSDKIGRKQIIIAGCFLAAATYFPLFKALTQFGNPAIYEAQAKNPVTVVALESECSFQFDPIGKAKFLTSCDIAKGALAKSGVSYSNEAGPAGQPAMIKIGGETIASFDGTAVSGEELAAKSKEFNTELKAKLAAAGYPEKADPEKINYVMVLAILTLLVIYVTMVYGPIAAYLVEMFPTRIRYTSMSLPYHIGNGWFGGFLPTVAFAIVAATGDIYNGLWYPVLFALMSAVLGIFILPETKGWKLDHHD
jgi:MFS family permease